MPTIDKEQLLQEDEENAGFEVNTNRVIIFSKNGSKKEFALDRKDRIYTQLFNYIQIFLNKIKINCLFNRG